MQGLKGSLYLLTAALCFSVSTVFLKFAVNAPYFVSPGILIFSRFFLGFIVFGAFIFYRKEPLYPNDVSMVIWRAVLNTSAVIFFFYGIKYTTITKANILNLTYPAFVFLVSPYITGEKAFVKDYVFLACTMLGAYFIVCSEGILNFSFINRGDIFSLFSGLLAGFGISTLRQARKTDTPQIILLFQMGIGSIITFFVMFPNYSTPHDFAWVHICITSLLTVAGQYFITEGYRYVSAALGSVVSSSGVLFSALLGISIFQDPITINIVIGALLIIVSVLGVSNVFKRVKQLVIITP